MASQELYSSVSDQLEAAVERMKEAIDNYAWDEVGAHATAIAELAKTLTSIFAELES